MCLTLDRSDATCAIIFRCTRWQQRLAIRPPITRGHPHASHRRHETQRRHVRRVVHIPGRLRAGHHDLRVEVLERGVRRRCIAEADGDLPGRRARRAGHRAGVQRRRDREDHGPPLRRAPDPDGSMPGRHEGQPVAGRCHDVLRRRGRPRPVRASRAGAGIRGVALPVRTHRSALPPRPGRRHPDRRYPRGAQVPARRGRVYQPRLLQLSRVGGCVHPRAVQRDRPAPAHDVPGNVQLRHADVRG